MLGRKNIKLRREKFYDKKQVVFVSLLVALLVVLELVDVVSAVLTSDVEVALVFNVSVFFWIDVALLFVLSDSWTASVVFAETV